MNPAYQLSISTANALQVDLRDYMERTRQVSVGVGGSDIFNQESKYHSWYIEIEEIKTVFNPEWIEYVQTSIPGFYISWGCIIYRKAKYDYHTESAAHIDCNPQKQKYFYYGLNFTIDQDDSEMVWYEKIDGNIDFNDRSTYFDIPADKLKEIYRFNVRNDCLSLVNTSVIHDVDNKGKDRWAISLRGLKQNEYGSWENTVKFFEPWIINN